MVANVDIYSALSATGQASIYQLDSNPLIARLSTFKDIGAESTSSKYNQYGSIFSYL